MLTTDHEPGLAPLPQNPAAERSLDWFRTATRWTQLTFVEDDPLHFDPDFWISVMRESRSDALCLSAGGYMAFYPTRIPFHYRSRYLGDTDPFGALVTGARELGMHVMARVDPHAIHADAAHAHPEWLARDADGNPIPHWAFPDIWLTDPFSSYHRDFITEVAREIVRDYDVDAVFANRWEGPSAISYSEGAERQFFDDTGLRLPRTQDRTDPAWRAYTTWRSRQLSELVVLWDDAVREVRPHARFIPNRGAMLTRDLVRDLVDDRYPMFFIDKQGRSENEALWWSGRIGKRSRGMFPDRPVALITSVGPEHGEYRWKDSVADPHEIVTWMADGFVHGALPWYTKFNANVFDTRWVAPIVEAFTLHERVAGVFAGMQITSEVAVLDNVRLDPTNPWASHTAGSADEDGFYQALVEARVPFDYIADQELTLERLAPYRVLILPNCRALSDAHCAVIREWVAGGGSLVAAHESSLVTDDAGGADLALGDVLGVRLTGAPRGPVKNNYITLDPQHPVAAGFDGATRVVGGTHLVGVEPIETPTAAGAPGDGLTSVPFRFVPDYPDLPMEEVYPRGGEGSAAVVCREQPGGGRSVYLAFNVGEILWAAMQHDHARLIQNAVAWALGGEPRVRVEGQGLVDVAVRTDQTSMAVALVNLNNPMAMRGQNRETIPLPPQEISVALPPGATGATARLLLADTRAPAHVADGRVHVSVPAVDVLEVAHLTWT
ncbi:alpha-amylase family protein [Occultella kanbiaonis]|uniref:alpha-amylase family protein n=1 Tax=Occultella kanbiaonis TaxID=2675754 RepID=UPI0013D005AF|nr:alpha-amylase family protein [Occultella kanbiaonis]